MGGRVLRRWPIELGAFGILPGLAFSPDGRLVACVYPDQAVLWKVPSGKPVRRLAGPFGLFVGQRNIRFLDDRYLQAGAAVWDTRTVKKVAEVSAPLSAAVAFSPERRRAVLGMNMTYNVCVPIGPGLRARMRRTQGSVEMVDVGSGKKEWSLGPHSKGVELVAFPPRGKRVVFAYTDGTVRVWDEVKDSEHRRVDTGSRCVAIAPDGRRVLCLPGDGSLSLWDVESGKELRRYRGHEAEIRCAAFSADGRLAVSGSEDGTVCVWRLPR